MTKLLSVAMLKGGTGKTTTAAHLAHGLALAGYDVLGIDLDQQQQLSGYFGVDPSAGIADVILNDLEITAAPIAARERLDIIPAGYRILEAITKLESIQFNRDNHLKNTIKPITGSYDYVLIDAPPGYNALAINQYFAAPNLVVPVSMSKMDKDTLILFLPTLEQVIDANPDIQITAVVPTKYDARTTTSKEFHASLIEAFAERVAPKIRVDENCKRAYEHGQTLFEYSPRSSAANDYAELTKWIIENV